VFPASIYAQAFLPDPSTLTPAEPTRDYQGYNFWLTKLNQFNGDYVAAEMVKAFIASTEYGNALGREATMPTNF
jgi:hypothetical protein